MKKISAFNHTSVSTPFRFDGLLPRTGRAWVDSLTSGAVQRALGLDRIEATYRGLGPSSDCDDFIAKACAALHVESRLPLNELGHIPATGPVVVVANHPYGGIDGLLLGGLLRRVRKDVRIMTNFLLRRIPELAELFISVDPFNGPQAHNITGMRQALRWLQDGGLLLVFPAGEVSHWRPQQGIITDPPWNEIVARLVHKAQASVVPVYVYGNNSLAFQLAGLVHPRLRTALLAKELLNKKHRKIALRIGRPLDYADLRGLKAAAMIRFLRLRTYLLGAMSDDLAVPRAAPRIPVMSPDTNDGCADEVAVLPPSQRLAEVGELAAYIAHAAQIPTVLHEIGRLRELTFRAVGEGTGKAVDLDEFDADYLHLFIWNEERRELVGAYRLGLSDHILARRGRKGLYTCQLFRMRRRLFAHIGPAIELGRSFIRVEYQRGFAPLLLLWKGISTFVARNPRYRTLFGPVSISNDYAPASRQLIIDYLHSVLLDRELARYVKPRRKPERRLALWQASDLAQLGDVDHISGLLANIEPDGRGMPVLLRQYLKLGGRILGFNVDRQFNDAIDALIVVDFTRCDSRALQRYMGKQQALDYLAHHRGTEGVA